MAQSQTRQQAQLPGCVGPGLMWWALQVGRAAMGPWVEVAGQRLGHKVIGPAVEAAGLAGKLRNCRDMCFKLYYIIFYSLLSCLISCHVLSYQSHVQ